MQQILESMKSACDTVGAFQLENWNKVKAEAVNDKSLNQLVSFVDQQSEQMLVEALLKALPNSTIIGEESASENRELTEYTWIIDPLDGTTNYLHGLPVFYFSKSIQNCLGWSQEHHKPSNKLESSLLYTCFSFICFTYFYHFGY